MRKQAGLTRIDVAVALACLALVLAQAAVLNAGGRERSKREVCLANLRSLASAWQTYSNDNSGKIPCGNVWYSWNFVAPQLAWVELPHPFPHPMPPSKATNHDSAYTYGSSITQAAWRHAIAEGTMWKYVGNYDIYGCPSAGKDQYVTYSMSQSMSADPKATQTWPYLFLINQIKRPAETFVFIDTGYTGSGGFYIEYVPSLHWGDLPPVIHNQGTTFVFADGHAIYRKWTDPHTLNIISNYPGWNVDDGQGNCDCDLRWMTQVTWGQIYPASNCTNPNKHCEY